MSKENKSEASVELKRYGLKGWIKAFVLGIFIGLADRKSVV